MNRKRADILSGAFWLACGAGLCRRSVQLGLGHVSDPGPGFTLFLAAIALAVFSVVLLLSSLWLPRKDVERAPGAIRWGKIGFVFLSMIVYGLVLPMLGFVLSTFLFVVFLLKVIEPKTWPKALSCGVVIALSLYLLFEVWLHARLPRGFWGF